MTMGDDTSPEATLLEDLRICARAFESMSELRKATLCERQNYPEFSIDNEPTLLYGRVCCGLGNPGDKRVSRRVLRRGDPCSECAGTI